MKLLSTLLALSITASALAENPFIGRWWFTLPGGAAGWLGVEEKDGSLQSSVLMGGGSVLPAKETKLEGDKLVVIKETKIKNKKTQQEQLITETITCTAESGQLNLSTIKINAEGKQIHKGSYTAQRIADLPTKPDLAKLKFGSPITLFNGKDLTGWKLVKADDLNGWTVQEGNLINRIEKDKHFGNLRTEAEFEDFNLKLELRTQEKSNSGVYLRGIYEIQVMESYGLPLDSHNIGALYSRITPAVNAEKPIGEWQTLDITLADRHLTVILNGKTLIDNQPILGCTGGAMTGDETKPGPILLQGDHTSIDYRNIVLTPIVK